jgi:hypothetical protein
MVRKVMFAELMERAIREPPNKPGQPAELYRSPDALINRLRKEIPPSPPKHSRKISRDETDDSFEMDGVPVY